MALSPASLLQDFGVRGEEKIDNPELVRAARDVLLQGLGLLFGLSDATYSRIAGTPFHAAIGSHYRSALERFQSLVRGFRAGEINYGSMREGPRLQDVRYASIATCDVLRAMKLFTEDSMLRECKVSHGAEDDGTQSVATHSCLETEVAYCIRQALQHYGIIRLICDEFGIVVPTEFGAAPQVQEHRPRRAG
jgi:hypothetical protein